MIVLRSLLGFALCLLVISGHAACLDRDRLTGVNLVGAEFRPTQLPGQYGKDYIYPLRENLAFFALAGAGLIRLPVRWERVQPEPGGPLDAAELARIAQVLSWARQLDLCLLLDLHNFGKYRDRVVGSEALTEAMLLDVWVKLATLLGDPDYLMIGLMNEPAAVAPELWPGIAQRSLLGLRESGVSNFVLLSSACWSGAHEFLKPFAGESSAQRFAAFRDPLDRYAIELHQYADADYSGRASSCISADRLRATLQQAEEWAVAWQQRLFLGEFGVADSPECMAALSALLEGMKNRAWLGWSYWAAGRWLGRYPYALPMSDAARDEREALLKTFFSARNIILDESYGFQ